MRVLSGYVFILLCASVISCSTDNKNKDETSRVSKRSAVKKAVIPTKPNTPIVVKAEYVKGRIPSRDGPQIIRGEFRVMKVIKGDYTISSISLLRPPIAEDDPKLMTEEIEETPLGALKFGKIYILGLEPTLSIEKQLKENQEKGNTGLWVNEEDLTVVK